MKSISLAISVIVQPTHPAGTTVVAFAPIVAPVPTVRSSVEVIPPTASTQVTRRVDAIPVTEITSLI